MQNWIARKRTCKLYLRYTELFEIELFLTLKLFLRYTELFEFEIFWKQIYFKLFSLAWVHILID